MLPLVHQLAQERSRGNGGERERYGSLLDACNLENVLDKCEKVLRFSFGFSYCTLLIIAQQSEISITEHFECSKHRSQRALQVVHDHLHQIVAHFLQLTQLSVAV